MLNQTHFRSVLFLAILVFSSSQIFADQVLFDFEKTDVSKIQAKDVDLKSIRLNGSLALQLATGTNDNWPGITLPAPQGHWDLSKFKALEIDVSNTGSNQVHVNCRVDNPGADGTNHCNNGGIDLMPGKSGTIKVTFNRAPEKYKNIKIIGMRGTPFAMRAANPSSFYPENTTALVIFVGRPDEKHRFAIDNIRATGIHTTLDYPTDPKDFFPMIDKFGQFVHKDWPGKIKSDADIKENVRKEKTDLKNNPGPQNRSKYGGWKTGEPLKATGFFRVEKVDGKWWFVDPDGYLFWSHGIDCVNTWSATPVSDREHYYADLPGDDSPLKKYYGKGSWAPHGYYKDHLPFRTYDFFSANLHRKFGADFAKTYYPLVHGRLKSWGINTIANWSSQDIYLLRKTPYVGTIHFSPPVIEGSEGYWTKFPDPFAPEFRSKLKASLKQKKDKTANDPWCIGYFVQNELDWKSAESLALSTLTSAAKQPAKQVFIKALKKKYTSIRKLNSIWGSNYSTWDELSGSKEKINNANALEDLHAFTTQFAEQYFRVIRDELKVIAPNQLYFGCRFSNFNDLAVRAAAKYCDVVSFNRYRYSVDDLQLPKGEDKPMIIGEFHFGALDRGMFHTGLKQADSQEHRAQLYKEYVTGALRHKNIVGTHWFQYANQATTGRGDGENYQIGFVDICDTPNDEIISASREIGRRMYNIRSGKN